MSYEDKDYPIVISKSHEINANAFKILKLSSIMQI